jgi:DNA polymerase-1
MTAAFEQGLDLHEITASRMLGKDLTTMAPEERKNARKGAKAVNFGSIYGQGAAGLVNSAWTQFDFVLDLTEAQSWLRAFEAAYPDFVQWRRDHYHSCKVRQHIVIGKDAKRGIGRIYPQSRVPEGESYYTRCCNLPVQGACADASMLALTYVENRLYEAGIAGAPVAWLHDEIVLEVRADQAEQAAAILKQAMIDGFSETFPGAPLRGLVEPHIGLNWGAAKADDAPKLDFAAIYAERLKLFGDDGLLDEVQLRVREHTIRFACARLNISLEEATALVTSALHPATEETVACL